MIGTYPLVTTTWLDQNIGKNKLRIIDIRGRVLPATDPHPHYISHRDAYLQSHLPGALFVDWITDITVDGPQNTQIAPPEKFAALMGKLGINNQTEVVVYDDADGMFAARLWWALNYYGHTQVAVLEGGWQKWVAENRATTDAIPFVTPTEFTPNPDDRIRRTADQVQGMLNTSTHLIDVRTPGEYDGKASRAKRFGHIPGAINLPRSALLAADGTPLPSGVLQDKLADMGISPDEEVVMYCNGGVSASFGLLALKMAGFNNAAVYDGSWKDWGNDDARPIE